MLRSSLSRFLPYPKRLEIVWCPFRGGQGRPGVELVPIRLMEAGLGSQLEGLGWAVRFDGHLQFQEFKPVDDTPFMGSKTPRLVSTASETIAKVVADHARQGELPLTLGEDHSLRAWGQSLETWNSTPTRMWYGWTRTRTATPQTLQNPAICTGCQCPCSSVPEPRSPNSHGSSHARIHHPCCTLAWETSMRMRSASYESIGSVRW